MNDVYVSNDVGVTWTLVTPNAGWSPRFNHAATVITPQTIVVTGGGSSSGIYSLNIFHVSLLCRIPLRFNNYHPTNFVITGTFNDVWKSDDLGVTWKQVSAAAPWSPRYLHSVVAVGTDSLYILGGIVDSIDCKQTSISLFL